jgi:cell division transport system permease protein
VFPASLEIALATGVDSEHSSQLAERVSHFNGVEEVETYRSFLGQFHGLLEAGWSGAVLLSLLVLVCVLAVIGNTIRVAVGNRKREIEVLKLCGATDGFVRGPFLVEGVLQAVTSASVAMLLLLVAYLLVRGRIESALSELTGVTSVFLSPVTVCGIIAISGLIGGLGSVWSLRRHLQV